jgi:hypothetical protein
MVTYVFEVQREMDFKDVVKRFEEGSGRDGGFVHVGYMDMFFTTKRRTGTRLQSCAMSYARTLMKGIERVQSFVN